VAAAGLATSLDAIGGHPGAEAFEPRRGHVDGGGVPADNEFLHGLARKVERERRREEREDAVLGGEKGVTISVRCSVTRGLAASGFYS